MSRAHFICRHLSSSQRQAILSKPLSDSSETESDACDCECDGHQQVFLSSLSNSHTNSRGNCDCVNVNHSTWRECETETKIDATTERMEYSPAIGTTSNTSSSDIGMINLKIACDNRPMSLTANPVFSDSEDDVVIVSALRTPICKAKRGGFKDTYPEDLLKAVLTAVINDAGISPHIVQDICVGNVMQPGAGANLARMAQFLSNFPESVCLSTVNRFCSSGLQACANIAGSIRAGFIDIGIGAGVETMTLNDMSKPLPGMHLHPDVFSNEKATAVLIPMGITSENVAEKFHITREKQDKFAEASYSKAEFAQRNGLFDDEIVSVATKLKDKDGNETNVVISKDDGVRYGTTFDVLQKLKPSFKKGGTTTAGNSSQVSDGAAAVLLARRSVAKKLNLKVLGVFRGFAVAGVPPEIMGIGPAFAIPRVLDQLGLTIDDIEIFEINEAFASQAAYCVEKLNIPAMKVNPKGGAIALGHPLGCTGARQISTLLHELKRRGKRAYGVVSMCIGTGMGAAAVIEYPGPY